MTTLTLDLSPVTTLSREQFWQLCAANLDMKLERNSKGELIIMAPTVEILEAPDFLSGEDVLLEFTLDVRFLWQ